MVKWAKPLSPKISGANPRLVGQFSGRCNPLYVEFATRPSLMRPYTTLHHTKFQVPRLTSAQFIQPLIMHQRDLVWVTTSQNKLFREKEARIVKGELRNNKLTNYPEEKKLRTEECDRLRHCVISIIVLKHRSGGSRGPKRRSIIAPIRASPLVKAFISFSQIIGWTWLILQPLSAPKESGSSRSVVKHKICPNCLRLLWFVVF